MLWPMRRRIVLASLTVFLLGATAAPLQAAPIVWRVRSPLPQGNHLMAVTTGGGLTIGVGNKGAIVVSANGSWPWESRGVTTADLNGIAYGNSSFVAIGSHSSGVMRSETVILTSADGRNWVQHTLGEKLYLQAIAYGNGLFMAVGSRGVVLTSPDGVTWRRLVAPGLVNQVAIAFGAGRFVIAGTDVQGLGTVLTTTDGASDWQTAIHDSQAAPVAVAYSGSGFVCTANSALDNHIQGVAFTSADGAAWEAHPLGAGQRFLSAITWGNGRFVALGAYETASSAPQAFYISTDGGATWSRRDTFQNVSLNALTFAGDRYIAVGSFGLISTSTDAYWWDLDSMAGVQLQDVTFGGGRYVAVGGTVTTTSRDGGVTWYLGGGIGYLTAVTNFSGRMVAVGLHGTIALEQDDEWITRPSPTRNNLYDITLGRGLLVAVGENGTVVTSSDGADRWTMQHTGVAENLMSVAYGADRFVVVGDRGIVLVSADGVRWDGYHVGAEHALSGVAYGAGRFVAVGNTAGPTGALPTTFTSTDGVNWSHRGAGARLRLNNVVHGAGRFLTAATGGMVLVSTQGENWAPTGKPADGSPNAVATDGTGLVAAGSGALILQSSAPGQSCGDVFPDVPAVHPACVAVEQLVGSGVINGYPDGTFRPEHPVTRAEFVKMATVLLGREPEPGGPLPFSDTARHWAAQRGYLQAAVALGLINGFPDGTFRPDDRLTRPQANKIAMRAGALTEADQGQPYADIPQGAWYYGQLTGAWNARLIGPDAASSLWPGPNFEPDRVTTRGEAAMLLANLRTIAW